MLIINTQKNTKIDTKNIYYELILKIVPKNWYQNLY